ncbi:MAG TPA: FkbM family methyltransferase [Opitutaceae bacterium]
MAGWFLKRCLGVPSVRRRAFRFIRKHLLRHWGAPFRARYYGHDLLFPGRHDLIVLTNDLPLFNTPLRRLAQAVREEDRGLRMLDIGANIGEGVPLADPRAGDRFWLVEGSNEFLPFLKINVAGRTDVEVFPIYLSESAGVTRGSEVVVAGNARLAADLDGEIRFETLDRIFPESEGIGPNLLKIDVEGHEPRIFRGGLSMLKRFRPVIFMEWYPRLLAEFSQDDLSPLKILQSAGYSEAVVYDNHGFLIEMLALDDEARLRELAARSRTRERFYFDLAVFGPEQSRLREAFVKSEADFYQSHVAPSDLG